MAEQKQPRNYISVDLDRESDELVKFTNQKNEFTGKLMSANNATDQAEDVRNIFIQDVKVNDVIQKTTQDKYGKKVVNIRFPYAGARIWVSNSVDGQVKPLEPLPPGPVIPVPKPGDFLIVKETLGSGITKNTPYVYVSYNGIQVVPIQISSMMSVSLTDHENNVVQGTIDSNGNANLKVDDLSLDTAHVNELYVDNIAIRDLIKQITLVQASGIETLDVPSGVTLEEVAEKVNELLQAIKTSFNS